MALKKKPFENIVGKGENAAFQLSNNVFYPIKDKYKHTNNIYLVVCKWFEFGRGNKRNDGIIHNG